MHFVNCPTCGIQMGLSERYPGMSCSDCSSHTLNRDGYVVKFYNAHGPGRDVSRRHGIIIRVHTPRGEVSGGDDNICFVNGIKCRASEAHMGGIVIEKM